MEKQIYITEEERAKCQKIADAFAELYEMENIVVLDVGRYGFVKLQYYKSPHGFEDVVTYTDSKVMFEDLWQEWLDTKLYLIAKGTPHMEIKRYLMGKMRIRKVLSTAGLFFLVCR